MKFNFKIDDSLTTGVKRLCELLHFECGEGIAVTAVKGERVGVCMKDGSAVIYYSEKNQFYRELGVLVENARKSDSFEIFENPYFKTVGVMMDTSRCAVPTVKTVKKLIDFYAVMGYNMAMLYTEDTLELEGRPYFGYMRGRYSPAELREIDDYAYEYGIEIIACLECYGHMEKYLMWPEASSIKDTDRVLLAREEKTFEFLEQLISMISSNIRSRRIHVGMDEAQGMGRGKFLDKNGYVDPNVIFDEFMERLVSITDKYGLTPMMWSDMYFRNNSDRQWYYDVNIEIPESTKKRIPKNVDLVFWHYGEEPYCDEKMLEKHQALGNNIVFAGGLWSWIGHFPEHHYALKTTKYSLESCRKTGVREMMTTVWLNDNAECDYFANLLGLSFTAELCYDEFADEAKLRERFESLTGGSFDGFLAMSNYHNSFENEAEFDGGYNYHNRFFGKPLFWQDIMEGLYDSKLFDRPMSAHYKKWAEEMKKYSGGEWNYLYEFANLVFEYLATKTEIAENLVPAYKRGDREMLSKISSELLPLLAEKTEKVHKAHRDMWFKSLKVIGWSNMDYRYAGVAARCESAKIVIDAYLSGECDKIEELEEDRLNKGLSGFTHFSRVSTVNLKT